MRKLFRYSLISLAFLLLSCCIFPAFATTRTVTNCADTGAGSLRQAITDAGAGDEIVFDIQLADTGYSTGEYGPGLVTNEAGSNTWFRIIVDSAELPLLSDANLNLMGSTQTREATNEAGPAIEVRCGEGKAYNGFYVGGNYVTVEGLVINGFSTAGKAGIRHYAGSDQHIRGCYIGVTASGEAARENFYGINIFSSNNVQVGGTTWAERNVISGNSDSGIYMSSTSGSVFKGNYVGASASGGNNVPNAIGIYGTSGSSYLIIGGSSSTLESNLVRGNTYYGISAYGTYTTIEGNVILENGFGSADVGTGIRIYGVANRTTGHHVYIRGNKVGVEADGETGGGNQRGIYIGNYAHSVVVGGDTAAERNIICNSTAEGMLIDQYASTCEVRGNYVGVDINGSPQGNQGHGVRFNNYAKYSTLGPGNIIASNGGDGVRLSLYSEPILITQNTMESNTGKGISIEVGSNYDIPYPTIESAVIDAGIVTITGVSAPYASIEVFKTEDTPGPDDQGEGKVYLRTVTAESDGSWSATAEGLSFGDKVTATASLFESPGYTSEFALNGEVVNISATVVAPNGGETWQGGTWHNISWEALGSPAYLSLYYTTSEALGYTLISGEVTGEASSYAWLVPNQPTTEAKVRIEAVKDSEIVTDESDAVFTITAATDFYVDANIGSNESYNGLTSEVSGSNGPWKTLTYTATQAVDFSTIHIAAGSYTEESFTIEMGSNKHWLGADRDTTTIEGSGATLLRLDDKTTLEALHIKVNSDNTVIHFNSGASGVEITDCKIEGPGSTGTGIYVGDSSLIGVTITVSSCEIFSLRRGYYGYYTDDNVPVIIQDCTFHDFGNQAIYNYFGNTMTIRRNTFYNGSSVAAIEMTWLSYAQTVENNTIVDFKYGINCNNGGTTNFKNNIVCYNGRLDEGPSDHGSIGMLLGGGTTLNHTYNNVWNCLKHYSGTSKDSTEISEFPGFVDAANNDYRLYDSTSYWTNPCKGTGDGGANIGNVSAFESGSPYRTNSYVDSTNGTDATDHGSGEGNSAYQTIAYANQYTTRIMNLAADTHTASSESIQITDSRAVLGAGRDSTTIESGGATVFTTFNYASIEALKIDAGTNTAIYDHGRELYVYDCLLTGEGAGTGVYFEGNISGNVAGGTVASCEIARFDYGINLDHANSTDLTITSCEVYGSDVNNLRVAYSAVVATITNSVLRDNVGTGYNQQSFYSYNDWTTVEGSTIVKSRYGLKNEGGSFTLKNSIIASEIGGKSWSGSTGLEGSFTESYNCIYAVDSGTGGGTGDINLDPHFIDATGGDFHLAFNSPCIDSGDPSDTDPDGSRADMGAYPFDQTESGTMAVYVISPNGGEDLTAFTTYEVTWYATKEGTPITHVDLAYSIDGGSTYTDIAPGEDNDGSYVWSVPNFTTTEAMVRVGAFGSAATDESDSTFTMNGYATNVVINCDDDGPGSLRWVLASAEAGREIIFDITTLEAGYSTGETYPGLVTEGSDTWFRIMVNSAQLPTIGVNNVYIHGSTQTREAGNSQGPEVEIRCKSGENYDGLIISGNSCTVEGLVINGFEGGSYTSAVRLDGGDGNIVRGCYLGTTASGEAAKPNGVGVYLASATNNMVGGSQASDRNIISGNNNYGVYLISTATSNEVKGNYFGTDRNGTSPLGNGGSGIYINGSYNIIGGSTSGERNLVSGNDYWGIAVAQASGVQVKGNYVGTDVNGTADLGNSNNGIAIISGANNCQIGGAVTGEGNVVSGNDSDGIYISASASNEVKGNLIGTDVNGTADLGNTSYGVNMLSGSQYNVVGGLIASERNVISGNNSSGVIISGNGTNSNEVRGNLIGTDVNGTADLGNTWYGITLSSGCQYNVIGSTLEAERNIISGNDLSGICFTTNNTNSNEVIGNYIGTDINGTADLGNTSRGVFLLNGPKYNIIGGLNEGERNIISGNDAAGISFSGSDTASNEVRGNYIGKDANGNALENVLQGVAVVNSSSYNCIGPANFIAHNGNEGVVVAAGSSYILITRNSMEANAAGGIDLQAGANNDIPYPDITAAVYRAGTVEVTGTSTPDAVIEVFKTESTPDPSGQGEGLVYLVSVEASGTGDWIATMEGLSVGDKVTATASLFLSPGYTSEFAMNEEVLEDIIPPTVTVEAPDGGEKWKGDETYQITWTATDESGIDRILIYYTSGEGWIEIATNEANDGSYDWLTPAIDTAEAKVKVAAVDGSPLHNVGSDESDSFFIIDSTGPSAPVLERPSNGSSNYDVTPIFVWYPSTDNLTSVASYEINIDNILTTQGATVSYTPTDPLSYGLHTWEVRAKDEVGNWGSYGSPFEVTIIPAPPNIVYNCDDSGPGSLRYVISSVEAGTEVIFDITYDNAGYSGGITSPGLVTNEAGSDKWFRIITTDDLPSIEADNVYIHGSTQTREANNPDGPEVEVRQNGSGKYGILWFVDADYCTVEGMALNYASLTSGIYIGSGCDHNRVVNCYIGNRADGSVAVANRYGVYVASGATYNIIGGDSAAERNILSGNNMYEVYLNGSNSSEVKGNYIGLAQDGDTDITTGSYGVYLNASSYNLIKNDVISGFGGSGMGIYLSDNCDHNRIEGNKIGTNASGTDPVPNYCGIRINECHDNVIGGTSEAERNIISGNETYAIRFVNAYDNQIKGNFFGLDVSGTSDLANNDITIYIEGVSYNNVIGGTTEGERNVIANSGAYGIAILGYGATSNEVIGNYIGTDVNGTAAMGNLDAGVLAGLGSAYNKIGGVDPGKGNVICDTRVGGGGGAMGVVIYGGSSSEVSGNRLGRDAAGGSLGNALGGVALAPIDFFGTYYDCFDNQVGPNNEIAYNSGPGVWVWSGADHNLITQNSMEANTGKGISLEAGANNDIPYPVITSAIYTAGMTTITGTSTADATIEIFECEPTPEAQGEGKFYLTTVTAESNGSWEATVPGLFINDKVTATASLFSSFGYTSEFAFNGTVESEGKVPVVQVIAPNGSEQWRGGANYDITWTATDESGIDRILIHYTSGEGWIEIATNEANDGSYDWLTPLIDTAEARVKVEAVDSSPEHNVGTDESNAVFFIDSTPPSIPVLVTPTDESYVNDNTPLLTWEAATDNLTGIGSYEITIDTAAAIRGPATSYTPPALADGTHTWEVKARDGAGNWGSASAGWDVTVDTTPPTVQVISPEEGEHISGIGPAYTIRWSASDILGLASDPISLYFSSNGGLSWSSIQSGLANSGTYGWDVPAIDSTTCRISVEAIDKASNVGAASSGDFAVDSSSPEVSSVDLDTTPSGKVRLESTIGINFSEAVERSGAQGAFVINPSISGTFSWSNADQTMTFAPTTLLSEGTTYNITISTEVEDLAGNRMASDFSYNFETISDEIPPGIVVKIGGVAIKSGDYIDEEPRFDILATDDTSLDATAASATLDGMPMSLFLTSFTPTSMEVWFKPSEALEAGVHAVTLEARDTAGNISTKEVLELTVSIGPAGLVGPPISSPMPFSTGGDDICTIAYQLNKDTDIAFYMHGPTGEIVWTRRYSAGENGGRAGYNALIFDGTSDITGAPLANGIYVFRIVAEGRAIGKGYIVIYD